MKQLAPILVAILTFASPARAVGPLQADAPANIPPLSEASLKKMQWINKAMYEAYDRVGHKDPKWDQPAREALKLSVEMWGPPRVIGPGNKAQYEAATRAVETGCDDPIVLYAYARTFKTFGKDPAKTLAVHQRAADALAKSDYSGYYKSLSQFRLAQLLLLKANENARANSNKYDIADWRQVTQRLQIALDSVAGLAKENDIPICQWIDLADAAEADFVLFKGGIKQAIDRALPVFEKHAPRTAALTFKGTLYIKYAWEARGGGFAGTVTDEGWKLFGERLEQAQKSLEEAWDLDHSNSIAAGRMITVELGQGQGKPRMETWFKRAMDADPDNEEACKNKLYYLQPKWYGTPQEMLAFARECLKTGRFYTDVPRIVIDAHAALSHYTRGGWGSESDPDYYKNPAVWQDLKQMYEGYLRAEKDLDPKHTRNQYAYMAWKSDAWADAAKMFAIIGDDFDTRVWTKDKYEAARKEAAEKSGNP